MASILYSPPFAVQPMIASFRAIDPCLIEASSNLGAGGLRTFLRISAPLGSNGILSKFILSFAHALGEFGGILMVGVNIPGVTRTISISIYDQVQALDHEAALLNSLFLPAASFIILSLAYKLHGNFRIVGVSSWRPASSND
jgi:molybdate transport system permease protein